MTQLDSSFPNTDVTYFAKWTAKTYPIVFDMADGGKIDTAATGWDGLTQDGFGMAYGASELPAIQKADGSAMDAPKRKGYVFTGWSATGIDGNGDEVTVSWYTALFNEDGTTKWTPCNESVIGEDGKWTDLSVVSKGADGTEQIVLTAQWRIVMTGSVPASVDFTIDPATMTATATTGDLTSWTPAPLKLEQVNVKPQEAVEGGAGFAEMFGQVDVDVKLNLSAQSGTERMIVAVPMNNQSVTLTPSQLMTFTIPAWDGNESAPSKLNVGYTLSLGNNVKLGQINELTKIGELYYTFSLAE